MSIFLPHRPPRFYLAWDFQMGLLEVMQPGIPLMELQSKCTVCYMEGENVGELNMSAQACCFKGNDLV